MTHIRSYISHFFIFFLSIVYLLFASSAQSQTAETKTTIEKYPIGIILPLSGSAASYGKYAKNSIDLAYNALPESDRSKIELFYEDDQLISQKSVAAYRKLRAEKNIQAAFVFGSGIGNALVPITEREKVILMAIGASDGSIAKGRQYAFLHWVTPDREATIYAEELKKRDYKRLAIVSYEHEGAIALMNAVKEAMEKIGISDRLVSEQTFVSTDIDFRTHITKLRSLSVDGVILLLFPGSLSSFAKQAKTLNLNADLAGLELFEDQHEVEAAQGGLLGQWYINADVANDSFVKQYQEQYHEYPGVASANSYDSLNLITQAVNLHGNDNDGIAQFLSSLSDYNGAAGKYSSTGDHRFDLPATVKVITEKGFEKLY